MLKKRMLGLLLAAVLVLSLLPAGVFAANGFVLGADSAEILNCGGKILHFGGATYYSEDGCVRRGSETLFYEDAANLNYADGALFFTRPAEDGFEVCKYDLASGRTEILLSGEGAVRQMYVVNGTEIYYLSGQAIRRFADGHTERLLANEGLWSFVPTPYGLVYAIGTIFELSVYAGDTLVTDCASSYHVDFDTEEPRLVYTTCEGDFEVSLRDAFGGDAAPEAYKGYGEVDVLAMLSEEYNETDEEIAAEEQTARNAELQTRAFNGAQGNDGALRGTLTQGQRNAQRRAYQMTDIEWTPKAAITGWGSGLTYNAGTTYKGLPYGQPVYASYVPWSTDLTGFINAVNNSSSKMYTDYSSYNKRAPYYSVDCSAFVSWALDMGSRQTTSYIANKGTLISSSSYANIQVGDYLNNAGSHVVMCTDITYDTSGTINGIEISESTVNSSTKYCCQRTWYGTGFGNSLSYFTSKYFGGGYSLYRSNTIANVSYSHVCVSPVYGDVCSTCGYGVSSGSSGSSGSSSGSSNTTKFGIDVSAHQGTINWDTVDPQIDFAIIRVGYGSDYTSQDDSQWANNVAACERLGIPYGVYLYSYANTTEKAASEAQHVIRLLQGHNPTLPVFYDLEDDTVRACGNATIYQFATIFCNAIEAAGYIPGVYANLNWWRNYLTDSGYDQWYRWVAQYNTSCTYTGTYCMWQNSSSYTMSGISGNTVDTDYWYGPFPNGGGGSTQPSGTYTITYKVPTDYSGGGTATVTAGDSVTLPSISTKVCGYTFMGWSTSAVSATTEQPTFYYAGQSFTPTKNTTLRALFCYYKDGNTIKGDIYYPACSSSQTGLAAGLSEAGATDTSYTYRSQHVAPVNFVYNYSGTAAQNTDLLNLLKAGMLVNPEAISGYTAYYNTSPGVCKRATATTTVAATCTGSGTKVTSCSYCGYSKTSTISPLGHLYATVITPPTCQTSGYTTYTCKREGCNDSYVGDEVPPGDHTLAFLDLGNGTHKQYCTVCGTVISTAAHTYVNHYCSDCGAYDASVNYAGTYYIAAKRTNDTNWHYLTDSLNASRYVIVDSGLTELPSAITSAVSNKAFTLTKNQDGTYLIRSEDSLDGANYLGWSSGNTGIFVAQADAIRASVVGQPDGCVHISFADGETTRYLSFNSTATNHYAAWYASQMKNLYLVPVSGTITTHTHSYTSAVTTAATCTTAGVMTYTCACGDTYTETIPATGHSFTYTNNGDGTHTALCSVCGYSETVSHTYENGVCVCGADQSALDFSGTYYIAAKRTNDTNWHYLTNELSSSRYVIADSGVTELPSAITSPDANKTFTLTKNQDGTYLIKSEGIYNGAPYLGWSSGNTGIFVQQDSAIRAAVSQQSGGYYYISFTDTSDATRYLAFNATAANLYAAWYSSQMKNLYLVPVTGTVPQHTHNYTSEVTTAATCTTAGVMTYTCALCGNTYTETIAAPGHDWQTGTPVAATCTAEGYTPLTCTRCGATDLQDVTDALGHVYAYQDNGNGTHKYYCTRCSAVINAAEPCVYDNGVCIGCGHVKTTGSNGDFVLVTEAPTDWSGTYLIVCESNSSAFDGSLATPNTKTNYHAVTIDDGVIVGDATVSGYAVTVAKVAGTSYYTIRLGSGKYMGSTGSSTGINATSTQYQNAFSLDANGNAVIANISGTNTYNFRFNTGSTSDRFAFYGASTGLPIRLYRRIDCQHSYGSGVVTAAATCTAAGVTTYTCSICGASYTEAIPALGHSYAAVVTAPTCTAAGCTTHTCSRCGASYTDAATAALGHNYSYTDNGNGTHTATCARCGDSVTAAHAYANGACVCGAVQPAAEQLSIISAQPSIDENVNLTYLVSVPSGYTNPYMVFTFLGASFTVSEYTVDNQGRLCFELAKILPQYLGENIRAELHATMGGTEYTAVVDEYSIRQYCVNQLNNNPSAKLKTLLSDLLTYGAAAQQYVGYNTNNLVTAGLSLTPSTFSAISGEGISFSGTANAGTDWKSATLVLRSTLAVRFYFTAASTSGLTVRCALNGRTQTFSASDFGQTGDGLYYVEMTGITATEFDDPVTATFYKNNAQLGRSASYSVNAYICGAQNSANASLRALVRALYNYGASASAYAK